MFLLGETNAMAVSPYPGPVHCDKSDKWYGCDLATKKIARILTGCTAAAVMAVPLVVTSGRSVSAATPAVKFSHEVVVDEQRDGFEPDIQVAPDGTDYTSVPNGSSTSLSFIWSSTDHANTFHIVPGNVASTGRLENCPQGGGDTEETLDAKGNLFFSDLQNLTNLTNSVSTDGGKTFSTTCAGATNTPVDRMWYALQGTLGSPNFRIYEEYDAVESGAGGGNQLARGQQQRHHLRSRHQPEFRVHAGMRRRRCLELRHR